MSACLRRYQVLQAETPVKGVRKSLFKLSLCTVSDHVRLTVIKLKGCAMVNLRCIADCMVQHVSGISVLQAMIRRLLLYTMS